MSQERQKITGDKDRFAMLTALLKRGGITLFEYAQKEDTLTLYGRNLQEAKQVPAYLKAMEAGQTGVIPEDRWKAIEFYRGNLRGPLEIGSVENGEAARKILDASLYEDEERGRILLGCIRDITELKEREKILEMQARTDSLTGLYNHFSGKELVGQYLHSKDPYASCGLMVIDIDFFKSVNDTYGHLFGDRVLIEFARMLRLLFDKKDVLIRAGGDEFVVFLKDIGHSMLVKKAMQLVDAVQKLSFSGSDYCMTCSVGVCFLPENISGYTYDQIFGNADWALYKAKECGRNQYVFCDHLQRFEQTLQERKKEAGTEKEAEPDIDSRYLHNDIVATAFEIFERMSSFDAAMALLLKVIGIRMQLDRITVIRTDISERNTTRQIQWRSPHVPETLAVRSSFTKEDFLTLFQSYDEYGTTVLQYDNMGMYSAAAAQLLMQGGAKTVVYAAMYTEGRYTGAISFVVCRSKRYWSKESRKEIGELAKIITVYLSRHLAVNSRGEGRAAAPGCDQLTGLMPFSRFKEEAEHKIVAGYAASYVMLYSDFENFKYFNRKCGYANGDVLLKDYSGYMIERLLADREAFFCRVVSDQFLAFFPYGDREHVREQLQETNEEFLRIQKEKYPEMTLRIRSGLYFIEPDCESASAAIDAANLARKQVAESSGTSVCVYDRKLGRQKNIQNELLNDMPRALAAGEFLMYLQPKVALADSSLAGAEALVRWKRRDGTLLAPEQFIPLFEENGRIVDLDFYMFEQAVRFLDACRGEGLPLCPISVNASVHMARKEENADRYEEILKRYGVSPKLLDVELTETATVSRYESVKRLFGRLKEKGLGVALDDFGAGYSVLNAVVDIPVDTVKLDRLFVSRCCGSERGLFFLEEIVNMIRGLGFSTVCEGIETAQQAKIVRKIGCGYAQGYFYSVPIPAEEFKEKYLRPMSI